jgi:hypothetical protein
MKRPSIGRDEAAAALLAFLGHLVEARVQELMALRDAGAKDADPLLCADRLGPNRRIVRGLIERGELAGVKLGARWHVRASEWARYVGELEQRQRPAEVATAAAPANDSGDQVADVLNELGLERVEEQPRRRAGGRR